MDKGLQISKFVNLKVRQLSAETCHDFIEWCGLIKGSQPNTNLQEDIKNYKHNKVLKSLNKKYSEYRPIITSYFETCI